MDTKGLIGNVSRYISLSAEEETFFLSLLTVHHLKKKQLMLQEGEVDRHLHYIAAGCMRAYSSDQNGFEHILTFGIEDWWVGDLHSFLTQSPATLNVETLEDSTVLQLSFDNRNLLLEKYPCFERFFRIQMEQAYIAQTKRLLQNISLTAAERYVLFVQQYPFLVERIPQVHIASYLGITPEFLSKIRNKLSKPH